MLRRAARLIGAAAIVWLVSAAQGSPINIDTFDLGSLKGHIFGVTHDAFSEAIADTSHTIGGERGVVIDALLASGDGAADFMVSGGRLAMGTNTAVLPYAVEWNLRYGPGLDADVINDDGTPNTGLLLEFLSAEYAYDLRASLYEVVPGHMQPPVAARISRALPANPNPHQVFLPFSQFTLDPTFDFTDVTAVLVIIGGAPDGDYELDRISVNVPGPAPAVLLLVGACAVRRRRRRPPAPSA